MKTLIKIIAVCVMVTSVLCGCTTTQKKAAYQTLAMVGSAVDSSMKVYAQAVADNKVTLQERERVRNLKLNFNKSYVLACDAAAFDYTSIADADLIKLKDEILNVIAEVVK